MIKRSDVVQAWPHDELKLTLRERWLCGAGRAMPNYHLVVTQGMVKLKKKKKEKKEVKMYERD